MAVAPTDPALLAELQRRLPCAHCVQVVVDGAGPFEAVLHVHPDMQHIFVERQRSPDGVLVRRDVGDIVELLHRVGAEATARKIATQPTPDGYVWVAWLGYGCALVAPWPRGAAS